jgi:four helix bundle protein
MIGECGVGIANWRMTTKQLKDRTFEFGIRVVRAREALPKNDTSKTLGRQLLRAGTSVGANYRSAARARSRADFVAKLGIVEEECDEASYWMEAIVAPKLLKKARLESLQREANELLAIVVSSIKTARRPRRK